jgi:hypothetical protein
LKEEALDRTIWRVRFGRGFGPFVRQTAKWMKCWKVVCSCVIITFCIQTSNLSSIVYGPCSCTSYNIVFVCTNGSFVGVLNEHRNLITMHASNNFTIGLLVLRLHIATVRHRQRRNVSQACDLLIEVTWVNTWRTVCMCCRGHYVRPRGRNIFDNL